MQYKVSKDPAGEQFYRRLIESRAFDVYLEEEYQPDEYHVRENDLILIWF